MSFSEIYRSSHKKNYTILSNHIIDNKDLSPEARIILITMLRNPDEYSYSIHSISFSTGISESKVSRAIKELTAAGHLIVKKSRGTGIGAGRGFNTYYEIHEDPIAVPATISKLPKGEVVV